MERDNTTAGSWTGRDISLLNCYYCIKLERTSAKGTWFWVTSRNFVFHWTFCLLDWDIWTFKFLIREDGFGKYFSASWFIRVIDWGYWITDLLMNFSPRFWVHCFTGGRILPGVWKYQLLADVTSVKNETDVSEWWL